MNDNFIIPLNGLTAGKNEFFLHAGKEFFDSFDNEEIFDADLQIRILVEKSGRYIWVDCDIEGVVTVECDRCLEMLDMPVDVQVRLERITISAPFLRMRQKWDSACATSPLERYMPLPSLAERTVGHICSMSWDLQ